MYLLGKKFEIETDHKPLVPLLSSKSLDNFPPLVLRFRLCMMKYNYSISHVPGKLLYTADALSRASTSGNHEDSTSLQNETEAFVAAWFQISLQNQILPSGILESSSSRSNTLQSNQFLSD